MLEDTSHESISSILRCTIREEEFSFYPFEHRQLKCAFEHWQRHADRWMATSWCLSNFHSNVINICSTWDYPLRIASMSFFQKLSPGIHRIYSSQQHRWERLSSIIDNPKEWLLQNSTSGQRFSLYRNFTKKPFHQIFERKFREKVFLVINHMKICTI